MAPSLTLVCSFFLAVLAVSSSVSASWRIPSTNESQLYNVWASKRRFHSSDTLFRYKNDSVAIVEKWGYYHCDSSNPIAFFNDGDSVINLDNAGMMYFMNGNADRCREGVNMMLEVMNPSPVRYFPTTIANPPMAPAPSQIVSSDGSPETSPGPSLSDSVTMFSVSVILIAVIVGLGLFALKA